MAIVVRVQRADRRTRRSTSPSSSISWVRATCTAARPDCALTSSRARALACERQRLREQERLVAIAPARSVNRRVSAPVLRMGVDGAALGDGEAFGPQRLDAEIVAARCDRALDLGVEQRLEHLEQQVLQRDRQRQQPVEEGA